jgi:hypothetical protein
MVGARGGDSRRGRPQGDGIGVRFAGFSARPKARTAALTLQYQTGLRAHFSLGIIVRGTMRINSNSKRMIAGAAAGFLYGLLLLLAGFAATGAGHGTAIPLILSAAPFSAFGVAEAIFTTTPLWLGLGILIARSGSPSGRRLAQGALLLQYLAAFLILVFIGIPLYRERMFPGGEDLIALWAVLYLGGQVLIWRYIGRQRNFE